MQEAVWIPGGLHQVLDNKQEVLRLCKPGLKPQSGWQSDQSQSAKEENCWEYGYCKNKTVFQNSATFLVDRDFIVQRRKELQDFLSKVLDQDQDQLANNSNTKRFLDLESYTINFQGAIGKP